MYTPLQTLAIRIYSLATPLHAAIEHLTIARTRNQWQRYVKFFTPNIRRLFPIQQFYVKPDQPMPKGYIFIPKENLWTTRKCLDVAEELGYPCYIVQADERNRKLHHLGVRVPDFIHDQVRIQHDNASFLGEIAAIHRADSLRLARIRLAMQSLYPALPPRLVKQILGHLVTSRPIKGVKKVGIFYTRAVDVPRAAHLSVTAFARHNYTEYDKLLYDGLGMHAARQRVEQVVNSKLREWRGWEEIAEVPKQTEQQLSRERRMKESAAKAIAIKASKIPTFQILKPRPIQ